jgi:hypothetical protein
MLSTLRAPIDRARHAWRSNASGTHGVSGGPARLSASRCFPWRLIVVKLMYALIISTLSINALMSQLAKGTQGDTGPGTSAGRLRGQHDVDHRRGFL